MPYTSFRSKGKNTKEIETCNEKEVNNTKLLVIITTIRSDIISPLVVYTYTTLGNNVTQHETGNRLTEPKNRDRPKYSTVVHSAFELRRRGYFYFYFWTRLGPKKLL